MRFRTTSLAALILGVSVCVAAPATADDAAVLVSDKDRKVTMTKADKSTATASVTLSNPTSGTPKVNLKALKGAADGCNITPEPATLEAHQQQKIKLTFSAECDIDRDKGTPFALAVGSGDSFQMHADQPDKPSPNWAIMGLIYLVAGILALMLLLVTYSRWSPPRSRHNESKSSGMSLPGLAASWKFSDSWAANATVITALFTGIFGADKVTNALLGEDGATDLLALALVSAAISVGLAGLSPMVLQMLRRRFADQPAVPAPAPPAGTPVPIPAPDPIAAATPAGLYVTPSGLLAAAVLTLAATAGQLATILYGVIQTDFAEDWILIVVGLLGLVVLAGYALISTQQNLTTGATLEKYVKPKPEGKSEVEKEDLVRTASTIKTEVAAAGNSINVGGRPVDTEALLAILEEATAPAPALVAPALPFRDERPSAIL